MAMRRAGAGWLIAGAFVILASSCFTQTEQSTSADSTAKSEQTASTEPVVNPEQTVTIESSAKPDHTVPAKAEAKPESTAPAAEPKKIESTAASEPAAKTESIVPSKATAKAEESAKSVLTPKIETSTAPGVPTDAVPMVKAFVTKLDKSTRSIQNSKKDQALIREGCRNLVNEILDLDAMSKAVNVEIWDKMTPAQRETIRAAFEPRMVGNCVRQFVGYESELLKLSGVRMAQIGNLLVAASMQK